MRKIKKSEMMGLKIPSHFNQPTTGKQNYVDNEKLSLELSKWKEKLDAKKELFKQEGKKFTRKDHPVLPEYVGYAVIKISQNIGRKHNFSGYTYLDEMIEDGIENVILYIHNFDPHAETASGTANAFAYITQIIIQAFTRRIKQEQKQNYYKLKAFEMTGGFSSLGCEENVDGVTSALANSGIGNDYGERIAKYESKIDEIKRTNREKAKRKREENTEENFFEQFLNE